MIKISRGIKDRVHVERVFDNIDIVKYLVKTSRRYKKGLIVARVNYEKKKVHVGWSLCNTAAGDSFCKNRAFEIAIGRMENHSIKIEKENLDEFLFKYLPQSLHNEMKIVFNRCERMIAASKKKKKKTEV